MRYPIYSRSIRHRFLVLAAVLAALIAAPNFPAGADVQAGVDTAKLLQWYRRAADQNLPLAQYAVAIHYRDGIGVPADQDAANAWFEKAARQGLAEAQINLGIRYWRGRQVPKNRILAYARMRNAAGQGDISAVQTLKEFEKNTSEEDVRAGQNLSFSLN